MPIVILIPTVICIILLFRQSVQRVFLNLYIPIFALFPTYYFWKVASLPPIDLSEAILFPLGVAIFIKEARRWKFAPMDLAVAVFIFTTYYADSIDINQTSTASTFDLFFSLCTVLVPYMAGKLLIEHDGQRVATLRRFIFCLFVACIISVYEYRMGQNPFTLLIARFFPDERFPWKTQIRWGLGRVSGPFGQSELAGMMLFFGLILTLWLGYNHFWEAKFRRAAWLPLRKSTVIASTIGIVLLMTQARGPWLGSLVAIPIALLGRARRTLRATLILAALALVAAPVAYFGLKAYTSGPTSSEAQENAQYRQQLLDNYIPVAKQGGPWGWGQNFPRIAGQNSIDNEYLFVALTQGWVGLLCFSLIAAETLYYLIYAAIYNPTKADRYFAFSLTGIFVGLLITVFTVFLGNQPYSLFFLLAGWSQAVRIKRVHAPAYAFEQVYT